MKGENVYVTPPPPEKNNAAFDVISTQQNYELLISGCTRLCKNYTILLYSYKNLLRQLESIISYNHTMFTHCLTAYKRPPPDTEKEGVFTRYLREHGFVPV